MVMHARKPQRIGDGYFEKHQAHPYQNSKYSSSKGSYDRDRMRERDSPNGNSYRSESPECDSPRDRGGPYHAKTIYLSKPREKERENRDYKPRDKYADCVRSPKDKRSRDSRDSEHRTNHDRNSSEKVVLHTVKLTTQNSSRETSQRKLSTSCQDKREDRERVIRVGDWSEHLSSSGKKYYYNCKTEVSQWEKPREWLEPRPQPRHNYSTQSNRTGGDKHSNSRPAVGSSTVKSSGGPNNSRQTEKPAQVSSGGYWPPTQHDTPSDSRKQDLTNSSGGMDGQATDMEICSDDSTPTSETSYSTSGVGGVGVGGGGVGSGGVASGIGSGGGGGCSTASMTPVQDIPTANAPGPPQGGGLPQPTSSGAGVGPIHIDTNCPAQDTGPPTPTHSETQDCTDARKLLSPPSSLSSLQSLAVGSSLAAIRPQAPNLTPSLANHYRDDLVNHVRGWPADLLEKQAQKLSEEAHGLGSMCTRVSADLKCARSIVRLTEIQATLQEQRVLFLRQQIKNLEELKSQNSFMADEA